MSVVGFLMVLIFVVFLILCNDVEKYLGIKSFCFFVYYRILQTPFSNFCACTSCVGLGNTEHDTAIEFNLTFFSCILSCHSAVSSKGSVIQLSLFQHSKI